MVDAQELDVKLIDSPHVAFAFTQHLHATGQMKNAQKQLSELIQIHEGEGHVDQKLLSQCYLKLGTWKQDNLSEFTDVDVNLSVFREIFLF